MKLSPEDRAYITLAQKEGLQQALQRWMMLQAQTPEQKVAGAAKTLKDLAPSQRGHHIAAVVKAYPGLPLKEAVKRYGEKSLLPTKAAPVAKPKPVASVYPTIKAPKFPAMKFALDLQFSSQEEAQKHQRNRSLAGAAGGVAGAGLGGMLAGKRFGLPGAIAGGVAGSLLGGGPGKLLADVAHDIPQRTHAMYDKSMSRMNAAGGEGIRLASAMPSLTEFLEFAQTDHSADEQTPVTSPYEEDMLKRLRPMGLGAASSLEGGDEGVRNEPMGLPKYDGV